MDCKVLNNKPNYKTMTKPNLNEMSNTIKGNRNNYWAPKSNMLALLHTMLNPNCNPSPSVTHNHSPSRRTSLNPNWAPQKHFTLTHPTNSSSPTHLVTQPLTKEAPRTMITSDTIPMDLPAQDKDASIYGKLVHVSVGPDSTIPEHEGS